MSIVTPVDLYDELAGPEPDYDTAPETPGDADAANRHLRRLQHLDRQADEIAATFDGEIRRLQEMKADRLDIIARQRGWFEQALELYHRARLHADPTVKTIHLPAGTLQARAQQPRWDFDDEDAFVSWCQAADRDDLLRVKVQPEKAAVKKALIVPALDDDEQGHPMTDDGEVVPGVTVVGTGPSFSAKPAGPFILDDGEQGS